MGIIMKTIKRSYGGNIRKEDNKQTKDQDSSVANVEAEADIKTKAEVGKIDIEEVASQKTIVIMTQVKFFDSSNGSSLEREVNEFLKTLDSSRIKEISFNSHNSTLDKYTAMVVYETIE